MNIQTTPRRMAISAGLAVVLLLFLAAHLDWFISDGRFQEAMLSWPVLLIVLCSYVLTLNIQLPRRWNHGWILASFVLLPCVMVYIIEGLAENTVASLPLNVFWLNVIWCQLIYLLFFALTNHYRLTMLLGTLVCFVFGAGNYFVMNFRGNPLLPADLLAVGTAADVAGSYPIAVNYPLLVAALSTLLALLLALIPQWQEKRRHWKQVACSVLVACVVFTAVGNFYENKTWYTQKIAVNFWNQLSGYQQYGSTLSFAMNVRYLFPQPPDQYAPERAEAILLAAEQGKPNSLEAMAETAWLKLEQQEPKGADGKAQSVIAADPTSVVAIPSAQRTELEEIHGPLVSEPVQISSRPEKPNIIIVMNESFADLSVLGQFATSQPYLEFYHSLSQNTIKGNLLVSVVGGGTCNTEFEVLTGNSTAFLPNGTMAYQQYLKHPVDSLATVLRAQGYKSIAFHPGKPSSWERDNVYPLLGFEEFYTAEDVENPQYMRGAYISDSCNYDKVISLYEEYTEKSDQPFFLFNVTIQNHGGYQLDTADIPQWVAVAEPAGTVYAQAEQYFSLMRASDEALKKLITYFEQQEKPTLVLFFGDHQPNLEPEFIERLMGKEVTDLTVNEMQKRYTVPFFLWANYDIPQGYINEISANYLSTLLLQTAELDLPTYQYYLSRLYAQLPVITGLAYQGRGDDYRSLSTKSEWTNLLQEYEMVQYNNFFDEKKRLTEFYNVTVPQNVADEGEVGAGAKPKEE